jgi:hypothetical protein
VQAWRRIECLTASKVKSGEPPTMQIFKQLFLHVHSARCN